PGIEDEPAHEGRDSFPNALPPSIRRQHLSKAQQLALAEKRSKLSGTEESDPGMRRTSSRRAELQRAPAQHQAASVQRGPAHAGRDSNAPPPSIRRHLSKAQQLALAEKCSKLRPWHEEDQLTQVATPTRPRPASGGICPKRSNSR
ncbi:Acetyl-coA carboxylase, partial [Operophtera brumata]